MGLFYVWLKCYPVGYSVYEELITFVNREAADEWWRTISAPSSVHAGSVKRVSPQFYVKTNGGNICTSFDDGQSPDTRHFSERMFLACTIRAQSGASNFPTTILPSNEITDHISGRWYFIRSKADPFSHWYLRTSGTCVVCGDTNCGAIHVSSDHRTRFCVRVRNDSQVPEDFVTIGTDEVSIAAPKDYILHINDEGDLNATKGYQGETDLLFSDLKKRFITRAERRVNGEVWEYVESVERGVGETWELVE